MEYSIILCKISNANFVYVIIIYAFFPFLFYNKSKNRKKKFVCRVYLCEFDWTWEKVYTTSVCLPCQSAGSHTKPKIPRIKIIDLFIQLYMELNINYKLKKLQLQKEKKK